MKLFYNLIARLLTAILVRQVEMQHQVVEAQKQLIATQQELDKARKQIISLQKQLAKITPKTPKDDEAIWHLFSGMFTADAANSNDLRTVSRYRDWLTDVLGKKYIKPYVNPKVYMECVNHMTRGLPERVAELQTREELGFATTGQLPVPDGKANLSLVRTGR